MKKNIGANAQAKKDAAKARKNAKLAATPEEKRYDLYASIDPVLEKDAKKVIEDKKLDIEIKYGRFTVRNKTAKEVDEIKSAFKDCIVSTHNGRKVKKISFFTLKAATLRSKDAKISKPSNNTTEAKIAAKKARKTRNKAAAAARPEYAKHRNATKKRMIVGKRARLFYTTEDKEGNVIMTKVTHKRGFKGSTLENKIRKRANSVGQYLIRKEEKKNNPVKVAAKNATKKTKPVVVQKEMALAA